MDKEELWRFREQSEECGSDEYIIHGHCTNCYDDIYIIIKKGIKVSFIIEEVICETCGCNQENVEYFPS
jgi:hypothetical protein